MGKWWEKKIGRAEEDAYPKCGEEKQTPDHIVFRCRKVRRVRDEKDEENGQGKAGPRHRYILHASIE